MPLRGVKLLRSEILLRRVLDGFPFTFREAPLALPMGELSAEQAD